MSYLLRLWRAESGDRGVRWVWRASVEDPHTGQRRGFADLDRLFAFLRRETEGVEDIPDRSEDG
jgi:hypothetical protein